MRGPARRFLSADLCALVFGIACLARPVSAESCTALDSARRAQVRAVVDIRTVELTGGEVVRPAGIESFRLLTPDGDGSDRALQRRMTDILVGRTIRLSPVAGKPDRYGRVEALIALETGELLQEEFLREGLAIAMPSTAPLPCFDALLRAEAEARQENRGGWSGTMAHLPSARPDELAARIGAFAIFEGIVISVGMRSARTYLNFGRNWSTDVTVTVQNRDHERFGGPAALEALAGQRVRIRGFLEDWSGPALTLRSRDQIELLSMPAEVVQESP